MPPLVAQKIVLPGSSLDDLAGLLTDDDASNLLEAWAALWDPHLIATAATPPEWMVVDEWEGVAPSGWQIVIPAITLPLVCESGDYSEQVSATEPSESSPVMPIVVEMPGDRSAIASQIASNWGISLGSADRVLVRDFYALGYTYLQISRLTEAMHYQLRLEETCFEEATVLAAQHAVAGCPDQAKQELHRAFDSLQQARNQIYPVEIYLLDVDLTAPSSRIESWGADYQQQRAAKSLLATSDWLQKEAARNREAFALLREGVASGEVEVIGGWTSEPSDLRASPSMLLEDLHRARVVYQELLDEPPVNFAQFYSVWPLRLPQLLNGLGYEAVLLSTFDGSVRIDSSQARTSWTGIDGTNLAAAEAYPLSTGSAAQMLAMPDYLRQTINRDHIATLLFAGWSGSQSAAYYDLKAASRYGNVLGKFATLSEYFAGSTVDYATPLMLSAESLAQPASVRSPSSADRSVGTLHATTCQTMKQLLGSPDTATGEEIAVAVNGWSFSREYVASDDWKREEVMPCGLLALGTNSQGSSAEGPVAEDGKASVSLQMGGLPTDCQQEVRNAPIAPPRQRSQYAAFHAACLAAPPRGNR